MSSGGGHGGGLPFLHDIEHWIHEAHEKGGFLLPIEWLYIAAAVEVVGFFLISPAQTLANFGFLIFIAPIWIPILLGRFTRERAIDARRVKFFNDQPTVLLELKLPRDTRKTPLAMETIFSNIHLMSGENTWYKLIVEGRTRPTWSFELVSLGGKVHFYIWCRDRFRRPLENFLYAQYPGIEVIEATDYSRLVDPTHAPYQMNALEYVYKKIDAYPLKTYVDYGLDQVQKPEEQTDPLAQVLETLGSLGPNEQAWIQFVIRATKFEKHAGKKNKKGAQYTWTDEAREEIERIREELTIQSEYVDPKTGQVQKVQGFPNPTEGQKDRIKTIERNIGKLAFDVGIRSLYFAPGDSYHKSMGSVMSNVFKPFNTENYNSLTTAPRWTEHFMEYPWEDPGGHHLAHAMHKFLAMYRSRAFFIAPYVGQWNTMNVETLATMYHVPSSSVTTPSLPRIQSATSEAPSNLPT